MTMAEALNIIILFVQAIILIGQLLLSRKMSQQEIARERGYFIIKETNLLVHEEAHPRFRDKFDLTNGQGLRFFVSGNADVIIYGSELVIDGVVQKTDAIPSDALFTLDKRFNSFVEEIELSEKQIAKEYLDFKLSLDLKNCFGYKYKEIITMRFTKEPKVDNLWWLSKYYMVFK